MVSNTDVLYRQGILLWGFVGATLPSVSSNIKELWLEIQGNLLDIDIVLQPIHSIITPSGPLELNIYVILQHCLIITLDCPYTSGSLALPSQLWESSSTSLYHQACGDCGTLYIICLRARDPPYSSVIASSVLLDVDTWSLYCWTPSSLEWTV